MITLYVLMALGALTWLYVIALCIRIYFYKRGTLELLESYRIGSRRSKC